MDRVDFRFPFGNVVLAVTDARLLGGLGAHRLRISAQASADWLDDKGAESLLVVGRVSSNHQFPHHVGDLAPGVLKLRGFTVSEDLCLSLGDEQVHALDKERQGGDLLLHLDLTGTLIAPPPGVFPTVTSQVQVRVPESTWSRDLDDLGKVLGLSIRVPAPLTEPGGGPPPPAGPDDEAVASRSQAVARLRQARSDLADGRYEACAATCRLVFDSLERLDPLPEARVVFAKKARDRTQAERWAAIHHDIHSLLSGAHHDDATTQDFVWGRADAEAALAMAGSLAARVFAN